MTDTGSSRPVAPRRLPLWAGLAILLLLAALVAVLGMLAASINERRWEAQRPALVLKPIAQWEPNNAVWGENYPREFETFQQTRMTGQETKHGGSGHRDYLDADPRQVILFAGYGFSADYRQARGHAYSIDDVTATKRIKTPFNPGTCFTCKSTDVPRLMAETSPADFYAKNFHDLKSQVTHTIGCQDCHDPKTMNLRITRPALVEALASMGKDVNQATHQEMRSLVCAQCHVEYYFKAEPKNYLTFPWAKGRTVEDVIAYYDEIGFSDWTHAVSATPLVKIQHPDYELYLTGVHAYRGVSCADCHMPYRTEGGVKFTDHHVQSPLLNISGSCAVCHRWSEAEIRTRVESIQDKVLAVKLEAEDALVRAHFDVAAAVQAKVDDADLAAARKLLRHAQLRWDYVSASNGLGIHSPQEATRILADAINGAQQARLEVTRLLAAKGIVKPVAYPDISTREAAWDAAQAFVRKEPPRLLP